MKLTRSSGAQCQTLPLGSQWTAVSPIECILLCTARFPDTCQSVVYNADTQSCTPGSTAFGRIETLPSAIPSVSSNHIVYYLSQPVPTCNTDLGFALYDVCGTSACLSLSAHELNYTAAVAACEGMGSTIFIGDTEARFSLFWYVSLNFINSDTWIGLTDIDLEGHFVWENGNSLSTWQENYLWRRFDQPDNDGGDEHCVEARHYHWPGQFGLNDFHCYLVNYFICEE